MRNAGCYTVRKIYNRRLTMIFTEKKGAGFIILIALCSLLIALCLSSCPGDNEIGPDPVEAMNLKDFGTNDGIVYKTVSSGAELKDYFWETTAQGNYVINVTGDLEGAALDLNDGAESGIVISLRGAGSSISLAANGAYVDSGETLILRGITIILDKFNVDCSNNSRLIMEDGSAITGGTGGVWLGYDGELIMNGGKIYGNGDVITGDSGVFVGSNSVFIMNGGEIYGNFSDQTGGGVTVAGQNARFEKNPGGRIYNNTAGLVGNQVAVIEWPLGLIVLAHRNTEVTAAETLTISLNAAGDDIASETGEWDKPIGRRR